MRSHAGAIEKQDRLQEVLMKLTRSLAHTEEQIKLVQGEAKAVNAEQGAVGRAHAKVCVCVAVNSVHLSDCQKLCGA